MQYWMMPLMHQLKVSGVCYVIITLRLVSLVTSHLPHPYDCCVICSYTTESNADKVLSDASQHLGEFGQEHVLDEEFKVTNESATLLYYS